ncbi:retrovirus-related Pol polyprotein from transposon opus [Trichonephila clavipes]|nr:retrovirus-related Pol polyprotein from transposon opus [Trichonephila clavipes]
MDKGIMVADSFRSEQECCAELALVWKYAKEGKGNYYEVDGYLFRRDKILGESIGQLVIRSAEELRSEGADVKKFCESWKECQLTRSVRIKDRSSSTPVARPELPFEVGRVRNRCLHLATGRTRDDMEKKVGTGREERVTEKAGLVKSRHG